MGTRQTAEYFYIHSDFNAIVVFNRNTIETECSTSNKMFLLWIQRFTYMWYWYSALLHSVKLFHLEATNFVFANPAPKRVRFTSYVSEWEMRWIFVFLIETVQSYKTPLNGADIQREVRVAALTKESQ